MFFSPANADDRTTCMRAARGVPHGPAAFSRWWRRPAIPALRRDGTIAPLVRVGIPYAAGWVFTPCGIPCP